VPRELGLRLRLHAEETGLGSAAAARRHRPVARFALASGRDNRHTCRRRVTLPTTGPTHLARTFRPVSSTPRVRSLSRSRNSRRRERANPKRLYLGRSFTSGRSRRVGEPMRSTDPPRAAREGVSLRVVARRLAAHLWLSPEPEGPLTGALDSRARSRHLVTIHL